MVTRITVSPGEPACTTAHRLPDNGISAIPVSNSDGTPPAKATSLAATRSTPVPAQLIDGYVLDGT